MRVFLAILILVTQVAGPWLCCCGPARMLPTEPVAAEIAPEPTPPPTCKHCCQEEPTIPAESGQSPTTPEKCPCGGVQLLALAPDLSREPMFDFTFSVVLVASPLVEVVSNPSVFVADLDTLRELPHLTTAERLYAHHALRC